MGQQDLLFMCRLSALYPVCHAMLLSGQYLAVSLEQVSHSWTVKCAEEWRMSILPLSPVKEELLGCELSFLFRSSHHHLTDEWFRLA